MSMAPNSYQQDDPQLSTSDTANVAGSLGLDPNDVQADYAALTDSTADKRRKRYMALALAFAIAQAE